MPLSNDTYGKATMADEQQPENQVLDDSGAGQAPSVDPRAPEAAQDDAQAAKTDNATAKADSNAKDTGSKS